MFPACYCSQSTALSLSFHRSVTSQTRGILAVTFYSFSFQTIASRLGLEQYNSSRASVIVNARTVMDIRWHRQLQTQSDGPDSELNVFPFYTFTRTGRLPGIRPYLSVFVVWIFIFWGGGGGWVVVVDFFFLLWHHHSYSREYSETVLPSARMGLATQTKSMSITQRVVREQRIMEKYCWS